MIIPALRYADSVAALQWLHQVFGLEPSFVMKNDDGTIAHAELWIGDGCVMMGQTHDVVPWSNNPGTGNVYVTVEDVDAHFDVARAAGANVQAEPYDTSYGSREYTALDNEGNVWSFGTYIPERQSASETG